MKNQAAGEEFATQQRLWIAPRTLIAKFASRRGTVLLRAGPVLDLESKATPVRRI
jgi:hypothetical protein